MGLLDQKERVLDVVLTDKGRELLSKNQLNFVYFAFSDEGIDYAGALSSSLAVSSSVDNYVHRDLSFEADQRKGRDLKTFLYTLPAGKRVLPEFKVSANLTSSLSLERRFYIDTIILENRPTKTTEPPVDIVVRATVAKITLDDRIRDYVLSQRSKALLLLLKGDK